MSKPSDYEYQYVFQSNILAYLDNGWEYAADAGHRVGYEPVVFMRRLVRPAKPTVQSTNQLLRRMNRVTGGERI